MRKFVDCEQDPPFLLLSDLREWITEVELAHFVIEAVECAGMSIFNERCVLFSPQISVHLDDN